MSSPTEEAPKEVDPQPSGSTAPAPAPEAVDPGSTSLTSIVQVRVGLTTICSASPETPVKRGRGRPKGSKNRKNAESGATPATVPKKRGRPPKVLTHTHAYSAPDAQTRLIRKRNLRKRRVSPHQRGKEVVPARPQKQLSRLPTLATLQDRVTLVAVLLLPQSQSPQSKPPLLSHIRLILVSHLVWLVTPLLSLAFNPLDLFSCCFASMNYERLYHSTALRRPIYVVQNISVAR